MNIPYVMKRCTKCGEWLVANKINFGKRKDGKWGLKSRCKKCEKGYKKQYYEDNKEYVIKHNKQYYENNKEHVKEYKKQWKENNKEHVKEYKKQWYENNKEHHKEISKQWRENNPEKSFNYNNNRRLKEENQGRGITKEQWNEMRVFFGWRCAYSGETMKGNDKSTYGSSIDHIIALENGGLNEIWNIVPMRKGYNCSKNNNENSLNWYMEQEYFDIDRLNKIVEWQIYAYEKWGGEEFGELILITDLFEEED